MRSINHRVELFLKELWFHVLLWRNCPEACWVRDTQACQRAKICSWEMEHGSEETRVHAEQTNQDVYFFDMVSLLPPGSPISSHASKTCQDIYCSELWSDPVSNPGYTLAFVTCSWDIHCQKLFIECLSFLLWNLIGCWIIHDDILTSLIASQIVRLINLLWNANLFTLCCLATRKPSVQRLH